MNSVEKFQKKFNDNLYTREVNEHLIEVRNNKVAINNDELKLEGLDIDYIIGSGANAVVFKAKDNYSKRELALKIWLPYKSKGKSNKTRSIKEIEKMAKFDDEMIVKYYSSGQIQGFTYCCIEYIKGTTLREMLDIGSINSLSQRYEVVMRIVNGLRVAHEKSIYHGDLHLDNILITSEGKIKLLDFGTSFFSKKENSAKRESRIIFNTVFKVLGTYNKRNILNLWGKTIENYSPQCVRLILKAYSKVITLLEFSKHGLVDTIIEDIALFIVVVPFFNLKEVVNKLFINEETNYEKMEVFTKKFSIALSKRLLHNQDRLGDKGELLPKEIDLLYRNIKDNFIHNISKSNYERVIYKDLEEAKIFNGDLFSKYDENEEVAIDKLLNSQN